MATIRTVTLPWTTLTTKSTSDTFIPVTGWAAAGGVQKVRPSLELAARTNDLAVSLAFQTANTPGSPDTATSLSYASASSDTVAYGSDFDDISASTKGKQLVRWGFMIKNAASTDPSTGRAAGAIEIQEA